MVALALSHAVALAVAAQPTGPPPAPVVSTPAPHEISFGRVAGRVGPGTDRVSVLVDGRTFAEADVEGRRFALRVAIPARDVRLRVVAHDFWGRKRGTTVAPVFGLSEAAAPRETRGFLDEELARRVDELVGAFDGTSAVYVEDLATGAGAAWNAKARFPAASTVKVAIAIEVLRRIDEPAAESSLSNLVEAMLVHSDNEAANALLSWLGGSVEGGAAEVNALMESLGATDSHLYGGFLPAASSGPPIPVEIESSPVLEIEKYTSAWDLAQLHRFLHLATGGLGGLPDLSGAFTPADARYLVYTLAHSADHGKLDRHLGDGRAIVPHKAGWIDDSRHDAGLVYSPGGAFVVVVMTWNPNGVGAASDVLAGDVARAALERFEELRGTASAPARAPLPLKL
ncbi:MAG: class A beta-lactamase-related serine hydrolase [Actinobacteria bacterium]|nr:class A beta-lactamase-related serine hydrolase [Actinomycetota bacterium]